jgi:hypothetical protein
MLRYAAPICSTAIFTVGNPIAALSASYLVQPAARLITSLDPGAFSSASVGLQRDGCDRGEDRLPRRHCVAGAPGFEPGNGGFKVRCLTAWRRPNETVRHHTA